MIRTAATVAAALFLVPTAGLAQGIQPGAWEVKSTARELQVPGASGLLLRMMKGRSRSERRCVAPGQAAAGAAALLAPSDKSKCQQLSLDLAGGRFAQTLSCPQKKGAPIRVVRQGRHDAGGFTGTATMTGDTAKGPLRVVLDQSARRTGASCR